MYSSIWRLLYKSFFLGGDSISYLHTLGAPFILSQDDNIGRKTYSMNRITIHLEAILHNLLIIHQWMKHQGASWTVVTKSICGHADILKVLQLFKVRSFGDSRLENLETIRQIIPDSEAWYLRIPDRSSVESVVRLSDISLNSELEIVEALNEQARLQGKVHQIVVMVEQGDFREGLLPDSLFGFCQKALQLSNIRIIGIGSNLGCLGGIAPTEDSFTQLVDFHHQLQEKTGIRIPLISGGTTVSLSLLQEGRIPKAVNHFRIGEGIFLGTNLIQGGTLPSLRSNGAILEAEIAEIKQKDIVAGEGPKSLTPFPPSFDPATSDFGGYRAIISIGQVDTDIAGLIPVNRNHRIVGASSDLTVVHLGEDPCGLKIGDTIPFRVNYSAFVRLMSSKYIQKRIDPSFEAFRNSASTKPLETLDYNHQINLQY